MVTFHLLKAKEENIVYEENGLQRLYMSQLPIIYTPLCSQHKACWLIPSGPQSIKPLPFISTWCNLSHQAEESDEQDSQAHLKPGSLYLRTHRSCPHLYLQALEL